VAELVGVNSVGKMVRMRDSKLLTKVEIEKVFLMNIKWKSEKKRRKKKKKKENK